MPLLVPRVPVCKRPCPVRVILQHLGPARAAGAALLPRLTYTVAEVNAAAAAAAFSAVFTRGLRRELKVEDRDLGRGASVSVGRSACVSGESARM
jgi:hypothetical protein